MSGPVPPADLIPLGSPPAQAQAQAGREYRRLLRRVDDLRALRELAGVPQHELARRLEADPGNLSRAERRADLSLRTLRQVVAGLGGELDIVVRLPDHPPIRLEKLSHPGDDGRPPAPEPAR